MSCFWFHTWTKWKEIHRYEGKTDNGWPVIIIVQERICSHCDYKEIESDRII